MAIDILDPMYIVRELFGDLFVLAGFVIIGVMFMSAKMKLNFQWTGMLVLISILMMPIVFEVFLDWVPLVIIAVGVFVGIISWRFLSRD